MLQSVEQVVGIAGPVVLVGVVDIVEHIAVAQLAQVAGWVDNIAYMCNSTIGRTAEHKSMGFYIWNNWS